MRTALSAVLCVTALCFCFSAAHAQTYYVSNTGSDTNNGTSQTTPWATADKVNNTQFQPGDSILFERNGEWRDHIYPISSGTAGNPITFADYGTGSKPIFWGSDVLKNANFVSQGGGVYTYQIATEVDAVLCNGVFVAPDVGSGQTWACPWSNGTLTVTLPSDPLTDGNLYTGCTRGNVIANLADANGTGNGAIQSHIVFRNLVCAETCGELQAGNVQGYGIRIQGATDITVDGCEADNCGRHNIAIIDADQVTVQNCNCDGAQPNTPGGNSIYVAYADGGAPVARPEIFVSLWREIG